MTLERVLFTMTSSPPTVCNSLNPVKLSGAAVLFDVARGRPQNQRRGSIKFWGRRRLFLLHAGLLGANLQPLLFDEAATDSAFVTWLLNRFLPTAKK